MAPYQFRLPPAIYFGDGAADAVGDEAKKLGAKKALLVTDEAMTKLGYVERIQKALDGTGVQCVVYNGVNNEPTVEHVDEGLRRFKNEGCDAAVALGGGSPIDAAKAITAMAANPGKVSDYMGIGNLPGPTAPLIAIPATAGTGSEVTRFDIITDTATNVKMLIGSEYMIPEVALVDPSLTLTMPRMIVAATGVDALTHAIESYVSKKSQPTTAVLALSAIRRISRSLRQSWSDADHIDARAQVMLGSLEAGMSFNNSSVALVHGMSRPVGAYFHAPHGLSNAVLLPAVMEFSLIGAPERYADVAAAMGVHVRGLGPLDAARLSVSAVQSLCDDIQIPKMRDLGVPEDKLEESVHQMAKDAIASGSPGNNPRQATEEEIVELYWQAF